MLCYFWLGTIEAEAVFELQQSILDRAFVLNFSFLPGILTAIVLRFKKGLALPAPDEGVYYAVVSSSSSSPYIVKFSVVLIGLSDR